MVAWADLPSGFKEISLSDKLGNKQFTKIKTKTNKLLLAKSETFKPITLMHQVHK